MHGRLLSEDERQRTVERAIGLTPKPIALESIWDGDAQGWSLELWAVQPERKAVLLACLQSQENDLQSQARSAQPRPEIEEARILARRIFEALRIPYQAAPDEPTVTARWWDRNS